jgi:hypothetical protein
VNTKRKASKALTFIAWIIIAQFSILSMASGRAWVGVGTLLSAGSIHLLLEYRKR